MKTILFLLSLLQFLKADNKRNSTIKSGPFINETWYSGTIDVDNDNCSDLFYWWFESKNNPTTDPLVLWLSGGPGCSSELALFYENGPYMFGKDNITLINNPYSWNSKANLIFLD